VKSEPHKSRSKPKILSLQIVQPACPDQNKRIKACISVQPTWKYVRKSLKSTEHMVIACDVCQTFYSLQLKIIT
jgi:hypothetical protein